MRILLVIYFLLAACGAQTRLPQPQAEQVQREAKIQQQLVLEEAAATESRLYRIGLPILIANRQFCGKYTEPTYGFAAHSAADYSKKRRAAAVAAFGFGRLPKIYAVAAGPAAAAGIKVGDEILTVNGFDAADDKLVKENLHPQEELPLELRLRRDRKDFTLRLQPQRRCNFKINLVFDDTVNAWTDGEQLYFTTGIMRYLNQDNHVAAVFGHELAHITMEHVDKRKSQVLVGAVIGAVLSAVIGVDVTQMGAELGASAYSQEYEAEADYVGVYYTARSGWDVNLLPNVWRRMAAGHPQAIHSDGGSHPSSAARFAALEQTVTEVKAKRANGEELVPNPKQ